MPSPAHEIPSDRDFIEPCWIFKKNESDCHPNVYDLKILPRFAGVLIAAKSFHQAGLCVQSPILYTRVARVFAHAERDPEISSDVDQSLYFAIFSASWCFDGRHDIVGTSLVPEQTQ